MARHTGWLALAIAPLLLTAAHAQSPKVGDPPEASNMRLVGMSDLQARSAYQPTIHRQGGRYIAYIGHHGGSGDFSKPLNLLNGQEELNGTSIVDVTDPKQPKYLAHIPGAVGDGEAGAAQMTRVCDGKSLGKGDPNKVYLLRAFGREGHETWDVTDPAKPKGWRAADDDQNYLRRAACLSGLDPPGWRTRMTLSTTSRHPPVWRRSGLRPRPVSTRRRWQCRLRSMASLYRPEKQPRLFRVGTSGAALCRSSIARSCSKARRADT